MAIKVLFKGDEYDIIFPTKKCDACEKRQHGKICIGEMDVSPYVAVTFMCDNASDCRTLEWEEWQINQKVCDKQDCFYHSINCYTVMNGITKYLNYNTNWPTHEVNIVNGVCTCYDRLLSPEEITDEQEDDWG